MKKWKVGKCYQLIDGCEGKIWWTNELNSLLHDKHAVFEVKSIYSLTEGAYIGDGVGYLSPYERKYFKRVRKENKNVYSDI